MPPTKKTRADIIDQRRKDDAESRWLAARLAASPVPFASTAIELLHAVFGPPLTRRQDVWTDRLAEGIRELQQRVDGLEATALSENDTFVSTALHATQIALRTHQEEKLHALRNAVLNTALPDAPEASIQQTFLHLIDRFTPSHLWMLSQMQGPLQYGFWSEVHYNPLTVPNRRSPYASFDYAFARKYPKVEEHADFYFQVMQDLEAAGLTYKTERKDESEVTHKFGRKENETYITYFQTKTNFGDDFLRFISDPFKYEESD